MAAYLSSRPHLLDCAGRSLDLNYPRVMGILNITPDSFYDGGKYLALDQALLRARRMMEEGAAIIDIGGESTRPGALPVPLEEELHRVIPVIEALHQELTVPLSIDTSKPEVMRAAVAAGAGFINDIYALRREGALQAASELGVPICLMHMQGEPQTMQENPAYGDVVEEVRDFLLARVAACIQAGIAQERLILDPGFGFGKTSLHNLLLLRHLDRICEVGFPVLTGLSRKSLIGTLLKTPTKERLDGGLALATLAAWQGAAVVRTHDVGATRQALALCDSVRRVKNH